MTNLFIKFGSLLNSNLKYFLLNLLWITSEGHDTKSCQNMAQMCSVYLSYFYFSNYFNPLSASFTKWSNTLEQFVDKLPTNCLSVFDHFVGLGRKGLTLFYAKIKTSNSPKLLLVFKTFSISLKKKKNYGKSKFVIAIKSVDVCEICIKSYLYEESPFNCACWSKTPARTTNCLVFHWCDCPYYDEKQNCTYMPCFLFFT